jgi:hypothetical protein
VPGVAEVTVSEGEAGTFTVIVTDGPQVSRHTVRVPAGLPAALGCAHVSAAALVEASFVFLLEREPASSILRDFGLEQIGHYFPDYGDVIERSLGQTGP